MKTRTVVITVAVVVVLLLAYSIRPYISQIETQTATITVVERKTMADAIIVKNEQVISSTSAGDMHSYVNDGDKVAKGKQVASVYQGRIDPNVQAQLDTVNARIEDYEQNLSGSSLSDPAQVETVLKSKVDALRKNAYQNENSTLSQLKAEISSLLQLKYGENQQPNRELEALRTQKQSLEAQLGSNKVDLYAPMGGTYSSVVDGFEPYFDVAALPQMTVADFDRYNSLTPSVAQEARCKVMDTFQWYLVTKVPSEEAAELFVGSSVSIRFPKDGQTRYPMTVLAANTENGETLLVLQCTTFYNGMVTGRKAQIEIVKNRYEGFKIPVDAVHIRDGKEGVYIISGGATKFREITVLYKTGEFVVAKQDNTKTDNILLYDEIILSHEGVPVDD